MKATNHPAVRRATAIYTVAVIWLAGLAVIMTFIAMQDPTNQNLIIAAASVFGAILCGFLAAKTIKKLRYEYRYEDEDEDDGDDAADQA